MYNDSYTLNNKYTLQFKQIDYCQEIEPPPRIYTYGDRWRGSNSALAVIGSDGLSICCSVMCGTLELHFYYFNLVFQASQDVKIEKKHKKLQT